MRETTRRCTRCKFARCCSEALGSLCHECLERDAGEARMGLASLRDLTRQMREAQRRYFRTRDQGALRQARALEARVDSLIAPQPSLPGIGGAP